MRLPLLLVPTLRAGQGPPQRREPSIGDWFQTLVYQAIVR